MITQPKRRSAFTLLETLAAVAIIAVLLAVMVPQVANFVATAQKESDKRTLTVLNDALNRYKTQGGDLNALTLGSPIQNILGRLQQPLNWNGLLHYVLNSGYTYPARSLTALGNRKQFRFIRANSFKTYETVNPATVATSNLEVTTIAGDGSAGLNPSVLGQSCSLANFRIPTNADVTMATGADGTIYLATAGINSYIFKIQGNDVTLWAQVIDNLSGGGMRGITIGPDGSIVAGYQAYGKIIKIPTAGGYYDGATMTNWDWAGTGANTSAGDGGDKMLASFNRPVSPVFDESGNLYLFESGSSYRLRKISANGVVSTLIASPSLAFGAKLAYSPSLNKLITAGSTTGTILTIDPNTGAVATYASGMPASSWNSCIDNSGNVWCATWGYQTVIRVPSGGGTYNSSWMIGQPNTPGSSDGDATTAATFNSPVASVVASDGSLWVYQSGAPYIRRITPK